MQLHTSEKRKAEKTTSISDSPTLISNLRVVILKVQVAFLDHNNNSLRRSEYDGCVSGLLCDNGEIIAWDGAGCFGITTPADPTPPTISPDGSCFYEGKWYSDEEEISR